MVLIALLVAVGGAPAATLELSAVVDRSVPPAAVTLTVEGRWLDNDFEVELHDADGVSGDGLWTGRVSGDPARMVPLSLVMRTSKGDRIELARSTEMVDVDGGSITWALDGDPRSTTPRARRVALARPARQMERFETAASAAGVGWAVLVFLFVAWFATDRRSRGRSRRRGRG